MIKKTKKQHWVPKFIIRKWSNKDEYKFYDINAKKFNIGNLRNSENDIFYYDYLYEDEKLFKINEIENGLSKIEDVFAKIIREKIINKNDKVIINRLDLKTIKLYWLIEFFRSLIKKERAYNLEGTSAHNKYFKDKTRIEIDQEFLNQLHYFVFDVFDYIKSNPGFLPEKLELRFNKYKNEAKQIIEGNKKISFESDNVILSSILSFNNKSCLKIIKINDKISYNFLLTDNRSVEFYGLPPSNIYAWPILTIMPISPKYAIGVLRLNDFDNTKPSIYAKGSIWYEKFPGLFEVNHKFELKNQKKFFKELSKELQKNPKILNDKLGFFLNQSLVIKHSTNEDTYSYPIYELTTKDQVHLVNAMLHSQTYKYVSYLKGKDLLKAIETIKKYNIYRVEDRL